MSASSYESGRTALMLNELRLPTIGRLWSQFAERSDKEGWPATRFLDGLLEHPPRQNSCRPDMILDLGAIRKKDGTVRRSIQEQDGGAVTAAGERQCWFGGERDRSIGADIGTMA